MNVQGHVTYVYTGETIGMVLLLYVRVCTLLLCWYCDESRERASEFERSIAGMIFGFERPGALLYFDILTMHRLFTYKSVGR